MDFETIVIGAGISGLCAGSLLKQRDPEARIAVFDKAARPGGYMQTDTADGYLFDWGPNGFLDREPLTLEWVDRLGLNDELVRCEEAAAKRFIVKKGRLVELAPPPRFLVRPILSPLGRARMLMEPLIPKRESGEPESIWDFAARRIGSEAADTLVAPMVTGVFGGDAKQLSLKHCFPRMAAMEREYGGLFKAMRAMRKGKKAAMGPGGTLTSFKRGAATLTERAADELGDSLRMIEDVKRIERTDSGFNVVTEKGAYACARCIIATPPNAASKIISEMHPEASNAAASMKACNIAVVCTGYNNTNANLDGFGFLVPRFEKRRVLGCIWTSSVFPHEAPEGSILLRTMIGGATDPEAVDLSDDELLALVRDEAAPLIDLKEEPDIVRIYRHRNAIPQYGLNHGEVLAATEKAEREIPGLAFAGNGYRGVGLNDCVISAHRAVRLIHENAS